MTELGYNQGSYRDNGVVSLLYDLEIGNCVAILNPDTNEVMFLKKISADEYESGL